VWLAVPEQREGAWPLGSVFLVPLLVATRRAHWIAAACLGAFAGVLYGIGITLWIPEALTELGSSRFAAWAGLLLIALWAGPPVLTALGLASRATARSSPGTRAAALAAIVFGAEWSIEHAWWGVPWGLLGISQRGALGVAQLAVVGGVPLVSALLVAINALVTDAVLGEKRSVRSLAAVIAAWIALALAGFPLAEAVRPAATDSTTTELLLAQPDLPRGERWSRELQPLNLYRVQEFTRRARAEAGGVDAWVFPENLLTAPLDASPELASAVQAWVDELQAPVLSGFVLSPESPNANRYRNSVVWLEPGRGITARLDKERAIPLLESSRRFPGDVLLAPLFGEAAEWPKVEESVQSGPLRGPIAVVPVLCYEVLFPGIVAERRTPDSIAIVNLADDSWLPGAAASRQLLERARFRAIEQRLTLVRVAHGGLSAVVDEFGRVREQLPLDRYATQRVSLRASPPPTWREWAAILALPVGVFAAVAWGGGIWKRKALSAV
jgi:apolipoprotein N-acyltransferase